MKYQNSSYILLLDWRLLIPFSEMKSELLSHALQSDLYISREAGIRTIWHYLRWGGGFEQNPPDLRRATCASAQISF